MASTTGIPSADNDVLDITADGEEVIGGNDQPVPPEPTSNSFVNVKLTKFGEEGEKAYMAIVELPAEDAAGNTIESNFSVDSHDAGWHNLTDGKCILQEAFVCEGAEDPETSVWNGKLIGAIVQE